jgi:hypothetical protein
VQLGEVTAAADAIGDTSSAPAARRPLHPEPLTAACRAPPAARRGHRHLERSPPRVVLRDVVKSLSRSPHRHGYYRARPTRCSWPARSPGCWSYGACPTWPSRSPLERDDLPAHRLDRS